MHANDVTRTRKLVHLSILLCKNILNLLLCLSFFLSCAWLPPPHFHHVVMLSPSLLQIWLAPNILCPSNRQCYLAVRKQQLNPNFQEQVCGHGQYIRFTTSLLISINQKR